MDVLVEVGVLGALVPVATSAAVLLVVRRLSPGEAAQRAAVALAIALGFAVAWIALPWAPHVPERAWHWLPYLGLAAGVAGAFDRTLLPRRRHLPALVVSILCAGWLVPTYAHIAEHGFLWRIGVGLATFFVWRVADAWVRLVPVKPAIVLLLGWSLGCVGLMERSAIMKFAQLAGVVVAALIPVALLSRDPKALAGAVAPCVVLVVGLTFTAHFETFAPVPTFSTFALALAPLALLLHAPWKGVALAATAVGAALAAATYATL